MRRGPSSGFFFFDLSESREKRIRTPPHLGLLALWLVPHGRVRRRRLRVLDLKREPSLLVNVQGMLDVAELMRHREFVNQVGVVHGRGVLRVFGVVLGGVEDVGACSGDARARLVASPCSGRKLGW